MTPLAERFSLKGKRAFVTGSSRGIGRAVAYALAEAGAHVILHGTKDSPALTESLETARANGWSVEVVTGDLGRADDLEKIIAATVPADILILNASAQKYGTLEEFTPEEFDAHFDVNVKHSLRLIQAFLPSMQAKHFGRIIALGSVNQWKQSPRLVIYSATKSALSNVMQNCARKYACDNTYSNCFATVSLTSEKADVTGFTGLTCQPFYLGIISLVTPELNAYSALVKKVDYESFACIYRCAVS